MDLNDLKIELKLDAKRIKLDLSKELKTVPDPALMNEQLSQQPSKYAWIGVLYALAAKRFAEKTSEKQVVFAQLSAKHRGRREDNDLKVTDKIIVRRQWKKMSKILRNLKRN